MNIKQYLSSSKRLIGAICVALAVLLSFASYAAISSVKTQVYAVDNTKTFGTKFKFLVAKNWYRKFYGLQKRDGLADADGMIFLYDFPKHHKFGMKNMRFDLDFFFVDRAGKIIEVKRQVNKDYEGVITNEKPAIAVIEIPSKHPRSHVIKLGSNVQEINEALK